MRRIFVLLGLTLATAGPALAQSNRGAFGLDAMVAPTTGLGLAYYVTDGLSLRPWLGLGYSGYSGFYANAGAQLRYELAADSRVSPYLSATAQYSHYGNGGLTPVQQTVGTSQPLFLAGDLGLFGSGVGVRYRLSGSLALFAEGRAMYATSVLGSRGSGWTTIGLGNRTRLDALLGLTYFFR
jgi:hypothetical protein